MIEALKYLDAISLQKEIKTEGHSPLLVIASDYNAYFIKNTKGLNPATYLINEFICHYLLKNWALNTPSISAIQVDNRILNNSLSQFHKTHFYNNITFGSQRMDNIVELNEFISISGKRDLNRFNSPADLIKISLFDIWVENDDRKPTNPNILLRMENNRIDIIAIDNAYTFSSMDYDSLNPNFISNSYNDNLLYTSFVKKIVKYDKKQDNWAKGIKDYYYFCIDQCKKDYNEIIKNIPSSLGFNKNLQESLRLFLFDDKRNQNVLTEFFSRI